MAKRARVRLYPTGTHYIPGIRAVERVVPATVADILLAHTPAAFTRERPADQDAPDESAPEDYDDVMLNLPEFFTPAYVEETLNPEVEPNG